MSNLKRQLKKLQASSAPTDEFRGTLRAQLLAEHANLYPQARGFAWSRAFAVPVALCVVVMTMGTGTYAYASPAVTDGDVLYPVKQGIEEVEAQFYRSPEAAARFEARMLERRLAEAEYLAERREDIREQLNLVAEQLDLSLDRVEQLQENEELRTQIISRLENQTGRYQDLVIEYLEEATESEEATTGDLIEAVQDAREQIQESDLTRAEKAYLYYRVRPEILERFQELK